MISTNEVDGQLARSRQRIEHASRMWVCANVNDYIDDMYYKNALVIHCEFMFFTMCNVEHSHRNTDRVGIY